MTRASRIQRRLQGLLATALLLGLVLGLPTVLIAIGRAPWTADIDDLRTLLSTPDDGTLALGVFAAGAWAAWAVMTASVVVEALARLRGLSAPSLPGLALPQRAAGQLVAVAALLFVAAPIIVSGFPASPAEAAGASPVLEASQHHVMTAVAPVLAPVSAPAPVPPAASVRGAHGTVDYTVKRGDSLWKIAERLLGDGARYQDIVDLNRDVLGGRADFIVSGTVLRVPHDPAPPVEDGRTSDRYVVRTGDTLSAIAEDELGDPMRYPEIVEDSQQIVQPDGARLVDPDLIRPGWKLSIPGDVVVDPVRPPDAVELPDQGGPPPTAPPGGRPTAAPSLEPAPSLDSTTDEAPTVGTAASSSGWLMPGLMGGGAVLAGSMLIAIRAHRRTQLRYRRPGQSVAAPPPDLLTVEKTAWVSGAAHTDNIEQLDRLLRRLAASMKAVESPLPTLVGLTLDRGTVTLQLDAPADLPAPWTGRTTRWTAPLGDARPEVDEIPPYPMLVTVGHDDVGRLHLLNVEHLQSVTLTGDLDLATDLARHIAAELALNPWSVLVQTDTVSIGDELSALDPLRLRQQGTNPDPIERLVGDLQTSESAGLGEPEPFRVVITTSVADASTLSELLRRSTSRLGAAVIAVSTPVVPDSVAVELLADGHLRVADLGLDLFASGLTSDEARACGAIVDLTRESQSVTMPGFGQDSGGWRSLCNQAGALRDDVTDWRGDAPAGDRSLLPNSTTDYTDVAAAVTADVVTLAPVVTDQICRTVEDADPILDDDVAAWFSDDCPLPRLTLLGSVRASTRGVIVPAIEKRKPYFVEMLAFLASHPQGRTGSAVADAFSISSSRARTDLGHLREWLGPNPRTNRLHLPAATASRTFEQSGVKTYQVDDMVVDADLFRRLRARGQARGADGIKDLKTALRLVDGLPFDSLRERGWSWLLDGDRLHETIGCSIVDVAHIVVLDSLLKGDLVTARNAAETACRAAPYDDICRLDLIKVAATEGREDAAQEMLKDGVFERTDDDLPPISLPGRTGEVVVKQGWGSGQPGVVARDPTR